MAAAQAAIRSPRRIALAAGGTAGHIYPALEVAASYLELLPDTEIVFLGVPGGMETRLVPSAGFRLLTVPASPLFGTDWHGKWDACVNLARGTGRARQLLQQERSQFVLGFGGYASAGALIAARSLGLATAIYEPNASPGLTNRVISGFTDRIYTGREVSRTAFAHGKSLVTGVPVRPAIAKVGERRRIPSGSHGVLRVLVTGGSFGSAFLNRQTPELLAALSKRGFSLEVWHQTGGGTDNAETKAHYEAAGLSARVEHYIDHAEEAFAWADFAVICAGATTLAEVSAARLPCLVTPLSTASERHQVANARSFAKGTGLTWVTEDEWRADKLAQSIERLLRNEGAYAEVCKRLAACAPHGAARTIVDDCERLLAGAALP